jgi:F-type H+-transporting ATPase subunit delta
MSVSIVARRYAQALLELGTELGQLDAIVGEVVDAANAWEASADLRNAIENPLVAHDMKKAVMSDVSTHLGVGQATRNTLQILIDRRRMKTLPYIARFLRELADSQKGIVRAEVTTATPLSDAYYAKLQEQLERMTGKKVVVDRLEDAALIAGVVTRIGDRIFDGSLRTRLQAMKDALTPTES